MSDYETYYIHGNIRPQTIEFFRNMEADDPRSDPWEGHAHLWGVSRRKQFLLACNAGFNSLVFCTSEDPKIAKNSDFGSVTIRIRNPRKFASLISRKIGADRFRIGRVMYDSAKIFRARVKQIPDERLLADDRFVEKIYPYANMASIFLKPSEFRTEREIRFDFSMVRPPSEGVSTGPDPELADLIERVA